MANIVETAVGAGTFKTLVGESTEMNAAICESRSFQFHSNDAPANNEGIW